MKKVIILIFLSIVCGSSYSQIWAPVNAEWHYSESFFMGFPISEDYIKIESVKDTLFNGVSCSKLAVRHNPMCWGRTDTEYMYSEGTKVFFWDFVLNKYQMLYDFDKEIGESWIIEVYDLEDDIDTLIIVVDSIDMIEINSSEKIRQFVTYSFIYEDFIAGIKGTMVYNGVIIESIGDQFYMFNFAPQFSMVCDANFPAGLRCYSDDELGLYETNIAPSCEHVEYVGIDQNNDEVSITLFPNPCNGIINIATELTSELYYRVLNISGQLVSSGDINNKAIHFNNSDTGLYVVEILDKEGALITREKIFSQKNYFRRY